MPGFQTRRQVLVPAGYAERDCVLMHNGAAIRKRANWHLHLFVVRRRWQKAWIYAILALKNLGQALAADVAAMHGEG